MSKRFYTTLILLIASLPAFSADGYKIRLKLNGVSDSLVYLVHYYGKPLPTIYKSDSAKLDKNGVAVFHSKETINGGTYLMLLSDKATNFEFLLNNGDDIGITADIKNLPASITFKNSPENERFVAYEMKQWEYGKLQEGLMKELAAAKTKADSAAIREKGTAAFKKVAQYRKDYVTQYPNTLLANIFLAITPAEVPQEKHYLPDGTVDSMFAYNYYKAHYWDNFNFKDNRLINTPLLDDRLNDYFNKVVMQIPDSIEVEADNVLAKARSSQDLFNYTLSWLSSNAQNSKIMGMDEVFVYLVENYFMKGDATWVDHDALQKYIKRAREIAPNVIGNPAPDMQMVDINQQPHKLSDVQAKYTLILFWNPDCGHCMHEMPLLDSVYNAVLKDKGVKIYAVRTEGDEKKWQDYIKTHHMESWINVYDPEHTSNFRADYDVYATPSIYLLDEKKIIRGKRLDHTNVGEVINMLEAKGKTSSVK